MKLPDDVRGILLRRFQGKHRTWLVGEFGKFGELGESRWPLEIALGMPTERDALRQVEGVRAWVTAWRHWEGIGTLSWCERRWKALGVQDLPDKLALRCPEDVAEWVGEATRWARARSRYRTLAARWPILIQKLPKYFDVLADYDETDFRRLTEMIKWIDDHPNSNLYPRQIPVVGVDSKWLESRKGLISDLIATIQGDPTRDKDFFGRCGLRRPPQLIRVRVLDPEARERLGGLSDVSAPWEEVAGLDLRPTYAWIVENLQSGLAFADLPGAVVIMGLGYAVDVLGRIPWLRRARCLYWGDIDTHGFAILNRARSHLPGLESVLMDESTLMNHRDLWVEEKDPHASTELPCLTRAEQDLYRSIKGNTRGQRIRLEQERIPWDVAWETLRAITRKPG